MFIYMDILNSEPNRMDLAMFLELALVAIVERGGSVQRSLIPLENLMALPLVGTHRQTCQESSWLDGLMAGLRFPQSIQPAQKSGNSHPASRRRAKSLMD
jgi:hypothetical protein